MKKKKERKIIRRYKGSFYIADYINKIYVIFTQVQGEAVLYEGNIRWTVLTNGEKRSKEQIYYSPGNPIPKTINSKFKEIERIDQIIKEQSNILESLKVERKNIEITLTSREHLKHDLKI